MESGKCGEIGKRGAETDLSEFIQFGVGFHAAESNLGKGLSPVGPRQRPVKDRTAARLFGQERLRYPQIRRK